MHRGMRVPEAFFEMPGTYAGSTTTQPPDQREGGRGAIPQKNTKLGAFLPERVVGRHVEVAAGLQEVWVGLIKGPTERTCHAMRMCSLPGEQHIHTCLVYFI